MTRITQYRSEYAALRNAYHRCHNENCAAYYNYGARGITVAPEWHGKEGFHAFLDHIGPKPDPTLSLDRIDNDRGYEPGNVRWASWPTQMSNRRKKVKTKTYLARTEAICAAWDAGSSIKEIMADFDISRACIYRLTQKHRLVDGIHVRRFNGSDTQKLSDADVTMIRAALDAGVELKLISERFSISKAHISNIKFGRTRKTPQLTPQ